MEKKFSRSSCPYEEKKMFSGQLAKIPPALAPGIWYELKTEAASATTVIRYSVFCYIVHVVYTALAIAAPPVPGYTNNEDLLRWVWSIEETETWAECLAKYLTGETTFCGEDADDKSIRVIGPGLWFVIHAEAGMVRSTYAFYVFSVKMEERAARFPCGACKLHFINYMSAYPLQELKDQTAIQAFFWTFKFHNAVSERLALPKLPWAKAIEIYSHLLP